MSGRRVAAFRGRSDCRREAGAVQWCICGTERDSGVALEVLLSGAAQLQLPPQLHDAELHVRDESGQARWELHSASGSIALAVRAVQVHRRSAAWFAGALPHRAAPWRVRTAWALLLTMARIPGLARLLQRRRSEGHG